MGEVTPWPKDGPITGDPPKPIKRPCDAGLVVAWIGLETQLGTIEGYNRLVAFAEAVKNRIEAGEIRPQNPIYAIDVRGGTPLRPARPAEDG